MMSATLKKALCDVCPSYVQEKKLIGKYFEETSLDIALFAKLQEQLKAMQRTLEGEENYCYSGIQASAPRDLIVQQCLSMEDNNFHSLVKRGDCCYTSGLDQADGFFRDVYIPAVAAWGQAAAKGGPSREEYRGSPTARKAKCDTVYIQWLLWQMTFHLLFIQQAQKCVQFKQSIKLDDTFDNLYL
jgi:hypothetical protein